MHDWDKMEKLWQHCIYRYLRVDPAETGFVLTEPPANPPEHRMHMAEVLFETFGAQRLHVAVQGALALTAARGRAGGAETGLVVDAGDGATHIVPVVGGFVLGGGIRHIPLAGRNVTNFVLERLRDREGLPPAEALAIAQRAKEAHCYVCRDLAEEFSRYDADPSRHFVHEDAGTECRVELGYERFVGPELLFNPSIFSSEFTTPLHKVVDSVVMDSPIDCRKPLYSNIVLSGGTTLLRGFAPRLQQGLEDLVQARVEKTRRETGKTVSIPIRVVSHSRQKFAVWYGGSVLGASEMYQRIAHTKQEYDEWGPNIYHSNAMFTESH